YGVWRYGSSESSVVDCYSRDGRESGVSGDERTLCTTTGEGTARQPRPHRPTGNYNQHTTISKDKGGRIFRGHESKDDFAVADEA
ncbi:hypothetical protein FRB90_009518, partial [Tulasnella sp. 427]